jgi:hypothetical protein
MTWLYGPSRKAHWFSHLGLGVVGLDSAETTVELPSREASFFLSPKPATTSGVVKRKNHVSFFFEGAEEESILKVTRMIQPGPGLQLS